MFLPHEIAKLEEARIALALSELADEHIEVAGGVACSGGSPASWMNRVLAAGMNGPVSEEELDRLVRFYDERALDPEIEVCPFADLSLTVGLGERGFRLASFETVLSRELADYASPELPDGVTFEPFDAADEATLEIFVEAHVACFSPDGGAKAEAMAEGARRMARHPRTTPWLVRCEGVLAGSGALEILAPLATLIAAGVLEPFRGRGIQSALIEHRCALARAAGCTVATIGSRPLSSTGRNALRAGFHTAYTKAILQRGP